MSLCLSNKDFQPTFTEVPPTDFVAEVERILKYFTQVQVKLPSSSFKIYSE